MNTNNRYSRNILIEQVGNEGQQTLLNSKVLVAGAGGLGSGVITALAGLGVGKIGIIDNDKLELSNLNRQFIHRCKNINKNKVDSAKEWINEYNPDIEVKIYPFRLTNEINVDFIDEYDVIVDCFDSYLSKFLLCQICIKKNKPLIHGGITEFYGQVTTIIPGKSACLNCLFPEPEISSYETKGVVSPCINVISSLQAMEVLKIILNIGEPLVNKLICYNGLNSDFKQIKFSKKLTCVACNNKK